MMPVDDFNYLNRNTFFCIDADMDEDAIISFCQTNGFGHIMLYEHMWCRAPGLFESKLPGRHGQLREFIHQAHAADIIVTLHTRIGEVRKPDPLALSPFHEDLISVDGKLFTDPDSEIQEQVSRNLLIVADVVGADGLYVDGSGIASKRYDYYTPGYYTDIEFMHRSLTSQFTRPILFQTGATPEKHNKFWCLSGQKDHYVNVKRSGSFSGTRDEWNDAHIVAALNAMHSGIPAQVGWIDFSHGRLMPDGAPIEDQTPESMARLCNWAREHNCPIVLETTLESVDTHPMRDAILAVIRGE